MQWAEDNHCWIVEDDYDSEYRFIAKPIPALRSLPAADSSVILAGTFSKLMFPAVRLAYLVLPPQLVERQTAEAVQMVAEAPFPAIDDPRVERLGLADAEAMLALAELAKPGPFTLKAQSFGAFWGVKEEGRLIAMAGERLKLPGITELSGLATHPDRQGEGLGKLLFNFVAGQIAARGDIVGVEGDDTRVVGPVPKLDKTPGRLRWLGRGELGADSRAVLEELGFDPEQIAALVDKGTVGEPDS